MGLLPGLLGGSGMGLTWRNALSFLLRDEFTTTESAPMASPRTCEPGPGQWTITDTTNKLSIASAALEFSAGTSSYGDPAIVGGAVSRAAGLALLFRAQAAGSNHTIGFSTGTAGLNDDTYYKLTQRHALTGNAGPVLAPAFSVNTYYTLGMILRGTGAFFVFKSGSDWKIDWVGNTGSTSTLYPTINTYSAAAKVDWARVSSLGGPWATDYGVATERNAGSVSAGTTFTHEADCLIEWTATTVPSADGIDLFFRVQDADNFWCAEVWNDGTLELFEVVATTWTSRGSTAASTVTSGHRCVVVTSDTTIYVYSNNSLRITYASATNFKTETDAELDALGTGGVASDIISWPRTLSGSALAKLNEAAS